MGIPALWDLIKDQDRSFPIAQLAADHYQQHGRPLRIAIDEADWRFNNLTPQQVFMIRQTSNQPYQGIEKTMFYRICRLLTLNVQLLFVFDGPKRPWKRGKRGGNKIDYEQLRLLKEMLRHFGIPHHEAPGEAEAECARLQQLGVVDAVFSQDSDALVFGCDYLLRDDRIAKETGNTDRSKENTRKSSNSMRVVRGSEIAQLHGLDRDGLVLFAILTGGDYDTTGLKGCGASTAIRAVKAGLGRNLSRCRSKQDCMLWQMELIAFLQTAYRGGQITVPPSFPDIKILDKYLRPTVSSDDQLRNLRGLRSGWNKPLSELKLLDLTSSRFNIWGKLYMNWVGPVLLMRWFVSRDPNAPLENPHHITLKQQRAKMDKDGIPIRKLERKISFSPFGLSTLCQVDFEGGERNGYWSGIANEPFDPAHRVEWDFPVYWLEKMLPPDVWILPPSARKKTQQKRKQAEPDAAEALPPKRKKQRKAQDLPAVNTSLGPNPATMPGFSQSASSSVGRTTFSKFIEISDAEDSDALEELNFPMIRSPSVTRKGAQNAKDEPRLRPADKTPTSIILDLGTASDTPASDEDSDLERAMQLSLQEDRGQARFSVADRSTAYRPQASSCRTPNKLNSPTPDFAVPPQSAGAVSSHLPEPSNTAQTLQASSNSLSINQSSSPTAPPALGLSEIEQIRASRLRHFGGSGNREEHGTSPCIPSPSRGKKSELSLTPKQPPSQRANIICIDLTDD